MRHTEVTPRLSDHARERCVQMGISTKVPKRIWRNRMLVRPMLGQDPRTLVTSPDVPGYIAVVDESGWANNGGAPVIVTVMFDCYDEYIREGETYRLGNRRAS